MAAMYRYGATSNMAALSALLAENSRREAWQGYVADMLWVIAGTGKKHFPVQRYTQLAKRASAARDTRSGDEVVDDVLSHIDRFLGEEERSQQ